MTPPNFGRERWVYDLHALLGQFRELSLHITWKRVRPPCAAGPAAGAADVGTDRRLARGSTRGISPPAGHGDLVCHRAAGAGTRARVGGAGRLLAGDRRRAPAAVSAVPEPRPRIPRAAPLAVSDCGVLFADLPVLNPPFFRVPGTPARPGSGKSWGFSITDQSIKK